MNSVISPRTRTRPNEPSSVRFMAPASLGDGEYSGVFDGAAGNFVHARQIMRSSGASVTEGEAEMRVLIIGSGGREHALAWAIAASPLLTQALVRPGQPGHRRDRGKRADAHGETSPASSTSPRTRRSTSSSPDPRRRWWPASPMRWRRAGIACCGPSAAAAQLEGSKKFTKEVCDAAGIPTARWERFDPCAGGPRLYPRPRRADRGQGRWAWRRARASSSPPRADEAHEAVTAIMEDKIHGAAGALVVIEECLAGEEISVFALCDGEEALYFGAAAGP